LIFDGNIKAFRVVDVKEDGPMRFLVVKFLYQLWFGIFVNLICFLYVIKESFEVFFLLVLEVSGIDRGFAYNRHQIEVIVCEE